MLSRTNPTSAAASLFLIAAVCSAETAPPHSETRNRGGDRSRSGRAALLRAEGAEPRPAVLLQTGCGSSDYCEDIIDDTYHEAPVAYFRLGEHVATDAVTNEGSAVLTGSYSPTDGARPVREAAGLIVGDSDTAVTLTGGNLQKVRIDSSGLIDNMTVTNRTIELWFSVATMTDQPQILYAEGDENTGLNIFVMQIDGGSSVDNSLVVSAWDQGWSAKHVQTPSSKQIQENTAYFVALVLNGAANPTSSSTSGELLGYIDGIKFGQVTSVGVVSAHDSNGVVLGGLLGKSKCPVCSATSIDSAEGNFAGTIDEVAVFNIALNATSVLRHYNSGQGN